MDIGLEDDEAREMLNHTLSILDQVKEVMDRIPDSKPEPGSLNEYLESRVGGGPISFHQSMCSGLHQSYAAGRAIEVLIEHDGEVYPSAIQALQRTVLLGAGRLLLIYNADSKNKKVKFSGNNMKIEYSSAMKLLRPAASFKDFSDFVPPKKLLSDIGDIQNHKLKQYKTPPEVARLNQVAEAIRLGIEQRFGQEDAEGMEELFTWIWNNSSGAAHGYGWTALTGASQNGPAGNVVADLALLIPLMQLAAEDLLRASTHPSLSAEDVLSEVSD